MQEMTGLRRLKLVSHDDLVKELPLWLKGFTGLHLLKRARVLLPSGQEWVVDRADRV